MNKSHLLGMVFVLVAFITAAQESSAVKKPLSDPTKKESQTQQQSTAPQSGTEQRPFIVKVVPPANAQTESDQIAKDREKAANDRKLVIATYILGAIGAFQLLVFGYQAYQLRETVKAATEQSKAMERSISESVRSASAMERVATHIEISAKVATDSAAALRERTAQQMRAYLTVVVGEALYQDRKANIRFEGKPLLVNTGQTPAHKVQYRAKAAVLPWPLPPNFKLPQLPEKSEGSSVVGPRQNANLSAIVDNYLPDQDVDSVKCVKGDQGLYVWGVVDYEDIFGEPHETKFCQQIHWRMNNTVFGLYVPGLNDAN
jgi:hypothetical protein